MKLKNLPAAFRSCLAAHGVAKVTRASLTDPKVIAAGEACLGYLTPAERQQLLAPAVRTWPSGSTPGRT